MIKKLNTFYKISWQRKSMLVQAFWLSIYAYFMMKFFKKWATFGSQKREIAATVFKNKQCMRDIRFAILVVNRYVPWENVCRHQAYQAMLLCKKYHIPYQIFVGFKKNENGKIDGHAWTMVQGEIITGFCKPEEYTIQAIYS